MVVLYSFAGSFKHDFTGADTAIYAALDPKLKGMSRGYFLRPRDKPRWPSKIARYACNLFCRVEIIGITHGFSFINICQVPRKLFEYEATRPSVQISSEGPSKCYCNEITMDDHCSCITYDSSGKL